MIGWDLMLDSHAIFPSWLLSLGTVAAAGSCVCVSFYPSARVISVHLGFWKMRGNSLQVKNVCKEVEHVHRKRPGRSGEWGTTGQKLIQAGKKFNEKYR